MPDYLTQLEDQLRQATESGVHNRRRLPRRSPRTRVWVTAAGVSILLIAALVTAALALSSGRPVPAGHSTQLALRRPARDAKLATRRGRAASCVNSLTGTRTPCSRQTGSPIRHGGSAVSPLRPGAGSPVQHSGWLSPFGSHADRLVAQLYLPSASGATRPTAVGEVLKRGGVFGISIVGTGLPANTKHNVYAVWLTDGLHQSKLLGFVSSEVKKNGRLETDGILPRHAFHYRELLITLETQPSPKAPGTVVLKGSFHR